METQLAIVGEPPVNFFNAAIYGVRKTLDFLD